MSSFSKLKQIIEMMKDHNLAEVTIKQGEEELCVKKAQPAQQITAVPMFGAGMPGMVPGGRRCPRKGRGRKQRLRMSSRRRLNRHW